MLEVLEVESERLDSIQAYDAWEHLCADAFDEPSEGFIAVQTVFYDASSNPWSAKRPDAPLLHTVGCYIAHVDDWRRFRKEWRIELGKSGFEFFHMTDFEYAQNEIINGRELSTKNPYHGWSKDDFVPFLKRLHRVINRKKSDGSYRMQAFISSLVKPDYDKTLPDALKDEPGCRSHYMFNVANTMESIAQWANKHTYYDPIHYVFAGGDGEGGNLEKWFVSCWENDNLRKHFRLSKSYSHMPYDIARMKDEPALQAADIAAYEFNKVALEVAERGGLDIPIKELRKSLSSLCQADHNGLLLRDQELAKAFPHMVKYKEREERERRAIVNIYYADAEKKE